MSNFSPFHYSPHFQDVDILLLQRASAGAPLVFLLPPPNVTSSQLAQSQAENRGHRGQQAAGGRSAERFPFTPQENVSVAAFHIPISTQPCAPPHTHALPSWAACLECGVGIRMVTVEAILPGFQSWDLSQSLNPVPQFSHL